MSADYCQLAKELIKMLEKGKENGLIELAYDELEGGDIEAAIELFKERAGLSIRHKEKYAEGLANLGLGTCHLCQAKVVGYNFRKAGDYFNLALRAFQGHNLKGEIIALIASGIAAEASGDFKKALDKYYLAKKQALDKKLSDENANILEVIHDRIQEAGKSLLGGRRNEKRKESRQKKTATRKPLPTLPLEELPFGIPVLGEVRAGPKEQDKEQDDMAVYFSSDAELEQPVFALKVVGHSMESERIFVGDYIIVQRFGGSEGPQEGEIIVTKYLPNDAERDWDQDTDISDDELEGPTVKFFFEREKDGKWFCRLSTRKDFRQSKYTITTRYIRPIGRVTGNYRYFQL